MSTANFDSNNLGFPLYAREYCYSKVCPECGAWCPDWADFCEDCGASLADEEARYDEDDTDFLCDEVWNDLRKLNGDLSFFTVGLAAGYYSGLQFKVDWKQDRNRGTDMDPEYLDNEDAHYYFDCCRSVMLRKYAAERRKLEKSLAELAAFHGFDAWAVSARFSNGECWYSKIEPPKKEKKYRAKLAAAVAVNA